jgi:hypothetical protein
MERRALLCEIRGRPCQREQIGTPIQGLKQRRIFTQGVALGYGVGRTFGAE